MLYMNEFTLLKKRKVRTVVLDHFCRKQMQLVFPLMTHVITFTTHSLLMKSRLLANNRCYLLSRHCSHTTYILYRRLV